MEKYKEETISSYNQFAEEFADKFKELFDLQRRGEFQRFISLLSGKRILDLGCGSGEHSVYFKNQEFDITCIDISEEMIKLCRQKKLNAFEMDIEDLKFKENSFDGIWAVTSLLHIKKSNIPAVIDKLFGLLSENGILYSCVKEGEGEKIIEDKFGRRFFAFWKKEEFEKLFKKKFELVDFKSVKLGNTCFLEFFFRKI